MACEKSREGEEEIENICSVYLLRSRMHDHNSPLQCHRLSLSSVSLPLLISFFISLCVFFPLFVHPPLPPPSVISQHGKDGTQSNA